MGEGTAAAVFSVAELWAVMGLRLRPASAVKPVFPSSPNTYAVGRPVCVALAVHAVVSTALAAARLISAASPMGAKYRALLAVVAVFCLVDNAASGLNLMAVSEWAV